MFNNDHECACAGQSFQPELSYKKKLQWELLLRQSCTWRVAIREFTMGEFKGRIHASGRRQRLYSGNRESA